MSARQLNYKMYGILVKFVLVSTILVHNSEALLPPSRKASPHEAPYMVRISDTKKYCGGTIIRDK